MAHHERTTIENDRVQTELRGLGVGCEPVDPVTSDDPAVIDFERRKDEARQVSAYRNRPITPIFKTTKNRKRGGSHPA